MKKILFALALILGVLASPESRAQCDTIAGECQKYMTNKFISDGQHYRALLLDKEVAEFQSTFYGNNTYRISSCCSLGEGNIVFSIYDQDRNLLFSNRDQKNAPYWDFRFKSTIDCTIEATLTPDKAKSGCAVLMISFKQ